VAASALFWNILTDAQDIALNTVTDTGPTPATSARSFQNTTWGWNWGVKADLGFRLPLDDWDFSIHFAYLQSTKRFHNNLLGGNVVGTVTDSIYPLTGVLESLSYNALYGITTTPTALSFTSFTQQNSFNYYDGTLVLSREFFISKRLSLNPIAGVKGSYFRQSSNVNFNTTTVSGSLSVKNNYWGVGPQLGSGLRFGFTKNFSLDCQLDGALLWGKIINKENYVQSTVNTYGANKYQLVPNFNILAGFVYDANFSHNTKNMAVNLSYESRYFFNNISTVDAVSRHKGSTSMQGVNLGLTFSY
jgi:hypothetical protein